MNVLGLTLAANMAGAANVTHESVLAEAGTSAEDFEKLVRGVIHLL
jgi:purine nucleoside phosphorylase